MPIVSINVFMHSNLLWRMHRRDILTSGFGVFSVWMKIVRLLVGERPPAPPCAIDRSLGRIVGRRRVSDAVSVGNREALVTVLYDVNKAGRVALEIGAESLPAASARRRTPVDVEEIDILNIASQVNLC